MYLAVTHKTRWWRRATELQAVSAHEASAPLGVTSWRHLEEMEPELGCVGSRSAGKGKAFANSVEFLHFFKLQEECNLVREGGMR